MGVGKKGSSSILVQVDGTYIYSHSNDRASILYSTRAPDTPYQSLRRGSRAMFDEVKRKFPTGKLSLECCSSDFISYIL